MALSGKRCLLVGAGGMLGQELVRDLLLAGAELVAAYHSAMPAATGSNSSVQLDIADHARCLAVLEAVRPSWVINCAAYTAVDKAESDEAAAFGVNAEGAYNIARAVKAIDATLVHISTDYVFGGGGVIRGGQDAELYTEDDALSPCGIYGLSKYYGELLIREVLPESHIIARTSWLHGAYGPNFVRTILKAASERPELTVVADQFGCPTWAGWVSTSLVRLMGGNGRGLFHVACGGVTTWYDFACEILRLAAVPTPIRSIPSTELNRPAPRPSYSALSTRKLEAFFGRPVMTWQEGLQCHLDALARL